MVQLTFVEGRRNPPLETFYLGELTHFGQVSSLDVLRLRNVPTLAQLQHAYFGKKDDGSFVCPEYRDQCRTSSGKGERTSTYIDLKKGLVIVNPEKIEYVKEDDDVHTEGGKVFRLGKDCPDIIAEIKRNKSCWVDAHVSEFDPITGLPSKLHDYKTTQRIAEACIEFDSVDANERGRPYYGLKAPHFRSVLRLAKRSRYRDEIDSFTVHISTPALKSVRNWSILPQQPKDPTTRALEQIANDECMSEAAMTLRQSVESPYNVAVGSRWVNESQPIEIGVRTVMIPSATLGDHGSGHILLTSEQYNDLVLKAGLLEKVGRAILRPVEQRERAAEHGAKIIDSVFGHNNHFVYMEDE